MRTIIITGASGGLAQEMVKLLPHDRLILVGRSKDKQTALPWRDLLSGLTASTAAWMSWSITLAMGFLKNLKKSAQAISRPCLKSIPLP